jgi:hypothetical protein
MAAQYLALSDLFVNNAVIQAGTRFSDQPGDIYPQLVDPGWLPSSWAIEPLNDEATQLYWQCGPFIGPSPRQQWTGIYVPRPRTFWQCLSPINAGNLFQLSGLGASLPPKSMYLAQGGYAP